jgi:mannosyl-oligosaccharide glucosidase
LLEVLRDPETDGGAEIFVAKLQQHFQEWSKIYTKENHPPPWQTFVMKPEFGPGNVHMVQKVFEGPFEVSGSIPRNPRQHI